MADTPQSRAIASLEKLRSSALAMSWQYVADWIDRAEIVIEGEDSTPQEKLEAVAGVCGGLTRGEWDRGLVEKGGLEYLSLFEVPAELYQFCTTLPLDADQRSFEEQQISKYQHALEHHKARLSLQ